ncbi:acyl carrier protein [Streptomyces sp. NPDC102467]|uniref:acyl carrier protein n=1 Tax=Streptomyces sp. NPDC102467 TaxID=3366179 RepID=UPI00381CD13E
MPLAPQGNTSAFNSRAVTGVSAKGSGELLPRYRRDCPLRPDARVDAEAAASTAQQPAASGPPRTARPWPDLAGAALGMEASDLDGRRPLSDYGPDSLMAGRIRLQLARDHGLEVTAGQLLGARSPAHLEEITMPLPS